MKHGFAFVTLVVVASSLFALGSWHDGVSVSGGYRSGTAITVPVIASARVQKSIDGARFWATASSTSFSADVAASVLLTPFSFRQFSFSLENTLHAGSFYKYKGGEADFQWLGVLSYAGNDSENPFSCAVGYGGIYKTTLIRAANGARGASVAVSAGSDIVLRDLLQSFYIDVRKRFAGKHELYFRLASFDETYFPVWASPSYTVGYSFDVTDKFTLGATGAVQYSDQFTLTGVIDGIQARIFVGYRW